MPASSTRLWLRPPRWSPILVGLLAALGVLWLWRGLTDREHAQLVTRAHIASDASSQAIERQFRAIRGAVNRVATFSLAAAPGTEFFGVTTDRLIAETDGLDRLLVIDEAGALRRSAPRNARVFVSPQLRRAVDSLLARRREDRVAPGDAAARAPMAVIGLTDSPWGIALIQPVNNRLDGLSAVVALVDERTLLQGFTADTGAGFAIRAFVADSELVGDPLSAAPPVLESEIAFGTRLIRLTLTPKASARPSSLPDLVLLLGLAIAGLLALTLWLARKTYDEASAVGMSRMQRAIERATDGVWELELPSLRTHRSQALLHSLGLDPAHINGSSDGWNARIHPDDLEHVRAALDSHLEGRAETFECEYRVRAGHGDWHRIVDRGRVIERTRDGRPQRMLGISADITDRARTEAAREESERRFRVMFETAHQLQLLLALDGRILEANWAAAALAGPSHDLKGAPFAALPWWQPIDTTLVQERIARAGAGDANQFEAVLCVENDRRVYVDFSLKPIRDRESRVVQVLVEGRDLTERKRVEASLREIGALTTMGLLAARVAHEINNPLAGIQNAFLLVRGAIPTDHPHHRFVGGIEREISRIAAVTRQLYETYRPDQAMAATSSVILAVGDAVAFLEQVNRTRDVSIVTDLSNAPSLVPVPDALLRQALYNLVQNAVDASPPGGTVRVSAELDAGWCVIRVQDEGPGIPPELHERIFDPFFTTKDRSVKTGGMGIGLSLVHQSVTAVGGSISVSGRETGGTEFCVRLPMTPIDTGVLR